MDVLILGSRFIDGLRANIILHNGESRDCKWQCYIGKSVDFTSFEWMQRENCDVVLKIKIS